MDKPQKIGRHNEGVEERTSFGYYSMRGIFVFTEERRMEYHDKLIVVWEREESFVYFFSQLKT